MEISPASSTNLLERIAFRAARLAISYDNPAQWPAWNIDWDQEQARAEAFVAVRPDPRGGERPGPRGD